MANRRDTVVHHREMDLLGEIARLKIEVASLRYRLENVGRRTRGDEGDAEYLCAHGVGHGNNVHTCDGKVCCDVARSFGKERRRK